MILWGKFFILIIVDIDLVPSDEILHQNCVIQYQIMEHVTKTNCNKVICKYWFSNYILSTTWTNSLGLLFYLPLKWQHYLSFLNVQVLSCHRYPFLYTLMVSSLRWTLSWLPSFCKPLCLFMWIQGIICTLFCTSYEHCDMRLLSYSFQADDTRLVLALLCGQQNPAGFLPLEISRLKIIVCVCKYPCNLLPWAFIPFSQVFSPCLF